MLNVDEKHDVNRSKDASLRDPIILWARLEVIDVLIEAWQILNELTAPILGAVYVNNGVYYTYLPTFEF